MSHVTTVERAIEIAYLTLVRGRGQVITCLGDGYDEVGNIHELMGSQISQAS